MICKYRAWDKVTRTWVTEYCSIFCDGGKIACIHKDFSELSSTESAERIILMQSIGVKDNHNLDIFKDDIVKQMYDAGYWIGVVEWLSTPFHNGWYYKLYKMQDFVSVDICQGKHGEWHTGDLPDAITRWKVATQDDIKIIGNIHDNPKLLETKKSQGN